MTDGGKGKPGAECSFVTRLNEAVNFLHMLEERIKIAAETAVRGPAKHSGIFPQPEACCQMQICFSSFFQCAVSLRIIIFHNFY